MSDWSQKHKSEVVSDSDTVSKCSSNIAILAVVVGETSAVVARMFYVAGADVATCDLNPAENYGSIPH